ncbi:MAG: DEAD/DEAH box helicase [Treponema sp.]
MNFSNYNLETHLAQNIEAAGYIVCTPVQEQVLQQGLAGSDLYVQSQTGTGKTAAYLITIIQQMLCATETKKPALILVPTRELAVQVEEETQKLIANTGLKTSSFYGGVGYQQQEAALKHGVDVIIGTPGRIIDLEKSRAMNLSSIGFLIIDEADRMFDMGFYPDLRSLSAVLSKPEMRQTMLFSATLNTYVKNLAWEYTHDAQEITIEAETVTVNEIDQQLFHVAAEQKMPLLLGLLQKQHAENTIIFCNTKKTAEIVAKRLQINGYKAEYLIGDLPQSKRLHIINSFKSGALSCLVATDVAARGIDVNDLALVINYDLPNEAENYVHRIGRTARAGKTGTAYSMCSEHDVYSLPAIEKYIEVKIPASVPSDDDLLEDRSADSYIQLERYGARESSIRTNKKPVRRPRTEKSDNTPRISHKNGKKPAEHPDKQREELASLTFEQRMSYYKEQYGKNLASDKKQPDAPVQSTPKKSRRKKQQRRQSNETQHSSHSVQPSSAEKRAVHTDTKKKRTRRKAICAAENPSIQKPIVTVAPVQQKSLFARIKHFLGIK